MARRRHKRWLAHLLALVAFPGSFLAQPEQEFLAAVDAQRKALLDAVSRRDAARVASIFTADAKLMLPGFGTITGREAIQKFWQAGLSTGVVKGLAFASTDLTGEANGLLAETGTIATLDGNGMEKDHSRYLIVWKREESEWRIHRDIVNSELATAPREDRVGFPKNYRTLFKVLGVPARTNASGFMMTAYGNDLACSVTNAAQLPYPHGSIILMEFVEAPQDSDGKPMLDPDGQTQNGKIHHVDVMRRGENFGEAYGANRSGQWEFAGYHLDGTYSTAPDKSASCAQCHQKAGAAQDFVFPLKGRATPISAN